MDPVAARKEAISLLDRVLGGGIGRIGDLRRAWPGDLDFLLRRARQEAEHYLVTRAERERRFVLLLREFLERGGTSAELERAYDAIIRDVTGGDP